jgi:hypothetical protein
MPTPYHTVHGFCATIRIKLCLFFSGSLARSMNDFRRATADKFPLRMINKNHEMDTHSNPPFLVVGGLRRMRREYAARNFSSQSFAT